MIYFCVYCSSEVPKHELKSHAVTHSRDFRLVPIEVIESELYESVNIDEIRSFYGE